MMFLQVMLDAVPVEIISSAQHILRQRLAAQKQPAEIHGYVNERRHVEVQCVTVCI